jgi:hypothetical protein
VAWLGSRLNVGLWNLSVGLAATGCGPLVPIDGETDTDGPSDDDDDDDDDPSGETDPSTTFPTTTTSPPDTDPFACDPACPPDYFCVDGSCIPDDECYYGSGGGYGYCCYDSCCDYGCYYDCYVLEDCGPGEYCSTDYGSCYTAEELGNCEPSTTVLIALPVEAASGALALAFADVQPTAGEELFVVSTNEARLVTAGGTNVTPPVELPGADGDASATAVTSAAGRSFAVSLPAAGGVQLVAEVDGSLVAGPLEAPAVAGIVGGDFDGDGFDDVAGILGSDVAWLSAAGSGFAFAGTLIEGVQPPLAVGRFLDDGSVSVAAHYGYSGPVFNAGLSGSFGYLEGRAANTMSLAALDHDADGDDDIVGLTSSQGTMLVVPWENAGGGTYQYEVTRWTNDFGTDAEGRYRVGVGDFDGDGHEDLFVGSSSTMRVIHGSADGQFSCISDIAIPHAADVLAIGDLLGDGRADVAFSDGTTTTVLAHE